jgi:hypothetical protein
LRERALLAGVGVLAREQQLQLLQLARELVLQLARVLLLNCCNLRASCCCNLRRELIYTTAVKKPKIN